MAYKDIQINLMALVYMKFRRYILSIILPFWIRAGCPPRRLHLLSVRKLKTKGFQEILPC